MLAHLSYLQAMFPLLTILKIFMIYSTLGYFFPSVVTEQSPHSQYIGNCLSLHDEQKWDAPQPRRYLHKYPINDCQLCTSNCSNIWRSQNQVNLPIIRSTSSKSQELLPRYSKISAEARRRRTLVLALNSFSQKRPCECQDALLWGSLAEATRRAIISTYITIFTSRWWPYPPLSLVYRDMLLGVH